MGGVNRNFTAGAIFIALAGCATVDPVASRAVFQNPARYQGHLVSVCGYLVGTGNISERLGDVDDGLNIDGGQFGPALLRLARTDERAKVCLSGTIRHSGCETDPNILCTDWAYDYAIMVREIL